eukprot:jgi/Psemu1/259631/estExt_Genewise1Plus.C_3660017
MYLRNTAVLFLLTTGVSFWNSVSLPADGSCSALDSDTCEGENAIVDADEDISNCQDDHPRCSEWAYIGECEENPSYMLHSCRRSCIQCPDQAEELAKILEEKERRMRVWTKIAARIVAAREHIEKAGLKDSVKEICKNQHEDCTAWAIAGECENNKPYMASNCAPACMKCDMLLLENRCPLDPNAKATWEPGDLNAMFERLISEPIASKYPVTILSRDPWVVTLDNVISEPEAERLIQLGGSLGYQRSQDVGKKKPDGTYDALTSSGRTSTNAWCVNDCFEDPLVQQVTNRLSRLTQIEDNNSEYLQLLRYEPGQFYEDHHDYIEHLRGRQQGVRILTSYLYLNDVEAGGGTRFTGLNITVMPKRGRALFWPSVLNDKPHSKDFRTNHQALPVEKGIKYGANGWFHQYDFKTTYSNACT